jgi:acyl carrier protein
MPSPLRPEIERKLKVILVAELSVDPSALTAIDSTTPLLGHGIGLDSVEAMALVVGIEKEFEISLPDSDLTVELFQSVGTLTDYIMRKISEAAQTGGSQTVS